MSITIRREDLFGKLLARFDQRVTYATFKCVLGFKCEKTTCGSKGMSPPQKKVRTNVTLNLKIIQKYFHTAV